MFIIYYLLFKSVLQMFVVDNIFLNLLINRDQMGPYKASNMTSS